jgi:hypothetical protein
VISDVSRCRERAYVEHHKLHEWPRGYAEGPNEVHMIVQQILPLIEGWVADSHCQIWRIMPNVTWDNYVSVCTVFKFLG